MKAFLTTVKGKVIAGVSTVVIVGAIVAAVIILNSGYRTIAVEALNGITKIINNGKTSEAFVGQHLESGDDVTVSASSDMTLALDSDKFVFAKENTHFTVEATGKATDSRTTIHLYDGATLCRVDKKLKDSENFNVDTPNATMSVRGTVFRVSCLEEGNGDKYTVVDVFEGEVFVQVKMENGQNTEESKLLKAGESATIRSNTDFSEFVKGDEDAEVGNHDGIVYKKLTQNEAIFLGKSIDEGRTLSITKDLLYDYVEIIEHDFSAKGEEVEATCEEEGYYYDVCAICGIEGEKHIIDKFAHTYKMKTDAEDMYECEVCGKEADAEEVAKEQKEAAALAFDEASEEQANDTNKDIDKTASDKINEEKADKCANGHDYVESTTTPATCVAEGEKVNKCSRCGDIQKTTLPATGHHYVETSKEATCDNGGYNSKRCDKCGDEIISYTSALGHNYSTSSTPATCIAGGVDTTTCSRCGATSTSSTGALGHSYSLSSTTTATCTVAGTETYSCSRCGDSYTNSTGFAPHDFVAINSPATQAGGVSPYNWMCSNCGSFQ